MKPAHATTDRRSLRLVACLCAFAVWWLGVLAHSPELHAHAHASEHPCSPEHGHADHDHDANGEEHSCAVTLFQHGVENPLGFNFWKLEPAQRVSSVLPVEDAVARQISDLRLSFSQAPPAGRA